MTIFKPTNAAEVLDTVRWALSSAAPLEVVGHGSKRGIGRSAEAEHALELGKLSGVTLYEPAELVLSARAGTPLAEIEALLAQNGQELAFEPMDYGPLFGVRHHRRGTMGGVLMANQSGPRRLKAGAARDHILGISAVSGRGEFFRSGGRVVKNVTGYDLSKAMAGSWGTLAVVTDVTFKVLPAAQAEATVALRGLAEDAAASAMALAMGSSGEVSGAAHLPQNVAGRVADGALGPRPATLLRVEGFGPSVDYRIDGLRKLFDAGAAAEVLPAPLSRAVWQGIRDCLPFAGRGDTAVWRVSMTPGRAPAFVLALRMQAAADAFYDWQGGLVWLNLEGGAEPDIVRGLLAQHGGGHATLVRASTPERAAVPAFQPQPQPLAGLSARLKAQFDPQGILNPGRMG